MDKNKIIKEDFKHSYSSVSKFIRNPSEWLCHYALGLRSPSNAAMTRGNLAEFGAYYKIKRGMQQKDGKDFAKLIRHRFKKLKFLDAEKEIKNAIDIAVHFEKILYERQLRDIKSYQRQEVKKIEGLTYPVRMFTDFEFEKIIVDAKSTLRLPSSPKIDHIRQQGLYSKLYEKPTALMYATPKKSLFYELNDDDVNLGYNESLNHFKSLENYIKRCNNSLEEAIKITPLYTDPNPFAWDINIKQEAEKIWQKINS
jgi:hypothetical protein